MITAIWLLSIVAVIYQQTPPLPPIFIVYQDINVEFWDFIVVYLRICTWNSIRIPPQQFQLFFSKTNRPLRMQINKITVLVPMTTETSQATRGKPTWLKISHAHETKHYSTYSPVPDIAVHVVLILVYWQSIILMYSSTAFRHTQTEMCSFHTKQSF